MRTGLTYTEPLTSTLAHYDRELEETLSRVGVPHRKLQAKSVEGLRGARGKLTMLKNAVSNAARYRNGASPNLQVWPSLGLLEVVLWRSRGSRNLVMVHDPVPLRRQVGFDRVSRFVAARAHGKAAPLLIAHSDDAAMELRRLLPKHTIQTVLHPVLSHQRTIEKTEEPTVIVAGQYKPERDVELLRKLGPRLRHAGIRARIFGRGWQPIPGWETHTEFVPESVLDEVLGSAWVVLLPYQRYFQSGVAIRGLENGTVFVSPNTSFAADVLRPDSPLIIDDSQSADAAWASISAAIERVDDARKMFEEYKARADESWCLIELDHEA